MMLFLFAIAAPVLLVGGLLSKARQAALERQLRAEQQALEQLGRALVNSDGQNYHVTVNLDFLTSIDFPLSLTISDAAGITEHFAVGRDGTVTQENAQ